MDAGSHTEIIIAGLLLAVATLVTLARVMSVPYPIFLVLGGLAMAFVPGMPEIELDPELVLLIFLPPLLYSASFFASLRDLRRNVGTISALSVGLVLLTCVAVAVCIHAVVPDMSWPAAFVLGAIVSPTDPVAVTAIAERVGIPRRVVIVAEGESLINDGTAIAAYRVAVVAVTAGTFSVWDAGGRFLLGAAGGVAIGLAVGWVIANLRERLDDPPVEITISLFTAYAAYLPAEELGLSGVIAAVTVGLYMGSQTSRVTNAQVRLQAFGMWQILTFLLNSFLFVLIGLQLPRLLDQLREADYETATVIGYGLLASAVVVVARIVWVYGFTYFPGGLASRQPVRPGSVALIAWMGMRGAVSLAAALALPTTTDAGEPFTERPLILFITFCVILFTLVVQGLSLPLAVRWLRTGDDDDREEYEENHARKRAARAALDRLDLLADEDWTRNDSIDRLRGMYRYRYDRFAARFSDDLDGEEMEARTSDYVRTLAYVIEAQRETLDEMRREGAISAEVMRRIERELDLEEGRYLG